MTGPIEQTGHFATFSGSSARQRSQYFPLLASVDVIALPFASRITHASVSQ